MVKFGYTAVFCVLMMYIIYASTFTEATTRRNNRNLSRIKRLFLSSFMGNNQRQCTEKYPRRKTSKGYEIFVTPDRQNIAIEANPDINKSEETSIDGNYKDYFLNSIRQILTTDTLQKTSKALRELLTDVFKSKVTNRATNNESEQSIKYVPENTQTVNQQFIPIIDVPLKQVSNEKGTDSTYTVQSLTSVVGLVGYIISMPRKYSYEQVKGETVQKFTLDKNSNVLVTEMKRNMPPRLTYIDNRLKDIISGVPPSVRFIKLMYPYKSKQYFEKGEIKSEFPSHIFDNSFNAVNIISSSVIDSGKSFIPKNFDKFIIEKPTYNPTTFKSTNDENKVLRRQWILERFNDTNTSSFKSQHPSKISNELLTKLSDDDKVTVNYTNSPTQYAYKQYTDNGIIEYGDKSNITLGQEAKNIDHKKLSGDNTYTGLPIIVIPLDDSSTPDTDFKLQETPQESYKGILRGDIPES